MNRKIDVILGVAALLVLGLLTAVSSNLLPTGVEGEWRWPRIRAEVPAAGILIATAALVGHGAVAAWGFRALGRPGAPSRRREVGWVASLVTVAIAVQAALSAGAPGSYGVKKWAYVHGTRGATGYYQVARGEAVADLRGFLAEYPRWIARQGPDHLGTHPPGLIAAFAVLMKVMQRHDGLAGLINDFTPAAVTAGFDELDPLREDPITEVDRAAISLVSLLTLIACAATAAPLYCMARGVMEPRYAWATAACWPLAPAPNLFLPLADAAYPFFSAAAIALAVGGAGDADRPDRPRPGAAIGAGVVMATAILFSLAILPIGLAVALILTSDARRPWRRRLESVAWVGVGFLAFTAATWWATAAEPWTIWAWNLRHNADFYEVGEGAKRTYATWVLINPLELAIAGGLPVAVWGVVGGLAPSRIPRSTWCTLAVLAIVDLSGRSLAETARLWMIFLPPLFLPAGVGLARMGAGCQAVFCTTLLMGVQTLGLQGLIQCVFPP